MVVSEGGLCGAMHWEVPSPFPTFSRGPPQMPRSFPTQNGYGVDKVPQQLMSISIECNQGPTTKEPVEHADIFLNIVH